MRIYSAPPQQFIVALSKELKNHMAMPDWAFFVKTGQGRERVPTQADWYFIRAAAIMRTVAINGPIGTQKLRGKFGNRKNKGYKPEHYVLAGGSIIRDILQQLDKAGLTKQELKNIHKGRIVTPKGQSLLDKVAKQFNAPASTHAPKESKTSHAEAPAKPE
jgi:small subunit ribosomal protein S19e